jgi:hypothetical protein
MGLIYMLNASPTAIDFDVYQPRKPKASAYYRCVEDHFEQLEAVWDDCYQSRFGFWRPYVTDVIRLYLDCGDSHFGFARVKCEDCGHEYLLAYSCKRRHSCPSLAQTWPPDHLQWIASRAINLYLDLGMELVAPGQACHAKKVLEFGESLRDNILYPVPSPSRRFYEPEAIANMSSLSPLCAVSTLSMTGHYLQGYATVLMRAWSCFYETQ